MLESVHPQGRDSGSRTAASPDVARPCIQRCNDGPVSNVFLSGQLVCRDRHEAAIVAQFLPLHMELTRAEQGCLSFEVNVTENPLVWQVDEQFEDAASFRAHQQRVSGSAWGRATADIARRYEIEGL